MKLIDIYIQALICENIKNLTDSESKLKYADEVLNFINISYAKLQGGSIIRTKNDLINNTNLWKLYFKNNKLIAGRIYKDKNNLNKSIAAFTDGTLNGKIALYDIISSDIKFGRAYGEVSDKMEYISIFKFGATPVPNKYVSSILKKQITLDKDGYHYTRYIQGNLFKKILVTGDINMFKALNIDINVDE